MSTSATKKKAPTGIRVRHGRGCPAPAASCTCTPATRPGPTLSYEAWAYDKRTDRKIRKTFPTQAAAKAWRDDATTAVRKGTLRAAPTVTVREASEAWLAGARDGSIRNRSGDVYKPSAIRGYEAALNARILPDLGSTKLSEIGRQDVQDLADRLLADGKDPSTIRNAIMPLRVIFRRAVSRGEVSVNPCTGLELPAVRGRRDRIASPEEAADLLTTLAEDDRPIWATALYGGLRRGELMELRWSDVDLAGGILRVERSYDPKERLVVETKSRAGRRRVPIAAVLRDYLLEWKMRSGREEGLVFGKDGETPFEQSSLRQRARKAWADESKRRQDEDETAKALVPIGLHECRHTFASLMIAAGVNAKALSTYMGHANIAITLDRYGHLMPGNEDEAAGLLDAYLARADTAARVAQIG